MLWLRGPYSLNYICARPCFLHTYSSELETAGMAVQWVFVWHWGVIFLKACAYL